MNQKKSNPFVSIVVIAAMLILVVVAGIRCANGATLAETAWSLVPPLIAIVSKFCAVSFIYVGYFFFIPTGDTPPLIYPVSPKSSLTCIISTFLLPETFASFFKSTS